MTYTPRRLFDPTALRVDPVTLHTVPAETSDLLKQIIAANGADTSVRLFVSLVPAGIAPGSLNRLIPGSVIPPRTVITFDMSQVLNTGDSISGHAESANVLSPNNASFETSVAGWAGDASTSISRSTTSAAHGVASLRAASTSTAIVTLAVRLSTAVPVVRSREYTAKASFSAETTGRSCRVQIEWRREDQTVISTATSGSFTDFVNVFREISVKSVAPAEAAFARIVLSVDGVAVQGEGHFIDKVQLAEGDASVPWVDPALPGLVLTGSGVRRGGGGESSVHPDLSTHDAMGLATQAELEAIQAALNLHSGQPHSASDSIPRSVVTSKGDLIAGTGPSTFERLPVGTAGRFLSSNPLSPTGLAWVSAESASHPDLATHDALGLATDTELVAHTGDAAQHPSPATVAPPNAEPGSAAAVGTSVLYARQDHGHSVVSGTPSASNFGDAVAVGTFGAARADHRHGREINPLPAHVDAADPHASYSTRIGRIEDRGHDVRAQSSWDPAAADNTTAIAGAISDAKAAGRGTVILPGGSPGWSGDLVIPAGVGMVGRGSWRGGVATKLTALNASARLKVGNRSDANHRGPFIGDFDIDGAKIAINPFYIGLVVSRAFGRMHIFGSAPASSTLPEGGTNLLIEEAQNCEFNKVNTTHSGGSGVVFDGGTGGHAFFKCDSRLHSGWAHRYRRTYAPSQALYPEPRNTEWFGSIIEDVEPGVTPGFIDHAAGMNITYDQCQFAAPTATTITPFVRMSVTTGFSSAALRLLSCSFAGDSIDPATGAVTSGAQFARAVSLVGGTSVVVSRPTVINMNAMWDATGGTADFDGYATRANSFGSNGVNEFVGTAAQNTVVRNRQRGPQEVTRKGVSDDVLIAMIEGEAGLRVRIRPDGFYVGDGTAFALPRVVGPQGAAVADAAGGTTIDVEARAALNALLARARAHGLIAP